MPTILAAAVAALALTIGGAAAQEGACTKFDDDLNTYIEWIADDEPDFTFITVVTNPDLVIFFPSFWLGYTNEPFRVEGAYDAILIIGATEDTVIGDMEPGEVWARAYLDGCYVGKMTFIPDPEGNSSARPRASAKGA